MTAPSMLLVAREALAKRLADELGGDVVLPQSDPYDALMEMGRRKWPAVVIEARDSEFAGLCRASRRLQRDSRLLALCGVSDEASVRPLVGPVLDDYFIAPPSGEDLKALRSLAAGQPSVAHATAQALPVDLVAQLVEAATSVRALEDCLAAWVSQQTLCKARWTEPGNLGPDARPLLLSGHDRRVLVCPGDMSAAPAELPAALQAIGRCLPALMDSAARMESMHRLAITDHLTGAYNRRYFYHLTEQILDQSRGTSARVALLLYDIDDFKHYNETYGYAVGDTILVQVADLMKRICRSHDIVARIGGDEFCVLFWDRAQRNPASRPLQTAYDLAERFRQAVAQERFTVLGPHAAGSLTISGGLALFPRDGQNVRELLRSADTAIKAAKRSGKNGIAIVGE